MLRLPSVLARWSIALIVLGACGRTPLRLQFGDGGVDGGPDSGPHQCTTNEDCADALACNGEERCILGQCLTSSLNCDDEVDCTSDRCLEVVGGCEHVPDHTLCDPGELCDVTMGCQAKTCA